jgi:hypothetical protein
MEERERSYSLLQNISFIKPWSSSLTSFIDHLRSGDEFSAKVSRIPSYSFCRLKLLIYNLTGLENSHQPPFLYKWKAHKRAISIVNRTLGCPWHSRAPNPRLRGGNLAAALCPRVHCGPPTCSPNDFSFYLFLFHNCSSASINRRQCSDTEKNSLSTLCNCNCFWLYSIDGPYVQRDVSKSKIYRRPFLMFKSL